MGHPAKRGLEGELARSGEEEGGGGDTALAKDTPLLYQSWEQINQTLIRFATAKGFFFFPQLSV